MPLGGIRPSDARKALESERTKDGGDFSTSFALELAYIIEHYGDESESEAREILDLHMKGSKSMILAVSFAQRNSTYSSTLWATLIEHCLSDNDDGDEVNGSLFGSLLEAAALSGSDLAHLVTQIPTGMAVEGLRPRLVAAVADYRLKLKMHEAASEAATQEMISILRELGHRSRRGVRYQLSSKDSPEEASDETEERKVEESETTPRTISKSLRTVERRDRYKLCLSPPMR